MRLVSLFSGGKDSTYATHLAKWSGHEIVCLLSMKPVDADSYMFHTPNIDATALQAEAMGIPLVRVYTKGEKEKELVELKDALRELKKSAKIEGVITGAVSSVYQASRIERICHELDLYCFNPLWLSKPEAHWHELLLNGMEIVLVRVAAQGLDKKWLGRTMDIPSILALQNMHHHGVSSIGEGGEFESFVCDAPLFKKKIVIEKYKDEWKGMQGTRHILKAKLVDKSAGKGLK